jgi:hypothetical protein
MKRRPTGQNPHEFMDEINAKQRNVIWPDTLIHARSVDFFLWRGSPNPTIVQSIAAWLFGVSFVAVGLGLLAMTAHD